MKLNTVVLGIEYIPGKADNSDEFQLHKIPNLQLHRA